LDTDYTLSVGGLPISISAAGDGKVTIPAGKSSVTIRLAVAPDALLEWDETVRIGERTPEPCGPRSGRQRFGVVQPRLAMRRRARLTALATARDRRSSWR
jgi:hypothetical protein